MQTRVLSKEAFILNGEKVNRLVMEVNGHSVQVLGYGESPSLSVMIDDDIAEQVHMILLNQFIERICRKVKR